MAGKDLIPMIVTGALVAFSLISWIILMAGVGAFQSWLDDSGVSEPAVLVSYYWWVIWFALPLLIAAVAAAVMKHPSILVRPLALLFAVLFTKLTIVCDDVYKAQEGAEWPDKADSRLEAALAGAVMLAIATLAMTIWLAVMDARAAAPAPATVACGLAVPEDTVIVHGGPPGSPTAETTKEAAAPGHAAAPAGSAGGYVVNNVPAQAPAGAGGYNYGTPGVANYAPQNNAAYAPAPVAVASPPPQGMPVGAAVPMQPGAPPAVQSPPDAYQAPGVPGVDAAVPHPAPVAAPHVSASHDGAPVVHGQQPAGQA